MGRSLSDKLKKISLGLGLAGTLFAGYFAFNSPSDSKKKNLGGLRHGEMTFVNSDYRYVGEIYNFSIREVTDGVNGFYKGAYGDYLHGKGRMLDKNGKVIREGYWCLNNPCDFDPIEVMKLRKRKE